MSVKEDVIKKSIECIIQKLGEIDKIINANPVMEIIAIRNQARELLFEYPNPNDRMTQEFMTKLKSLASREKEQFDLGEKKQDLLKYIDEKVELEIELSELKQELFFMDMRKNKKW